MTGTTCEVDRGEVAVRGRLDAPDMAPKSGMPPSDVAGAKPAGANEAEQPGKQMPATGPQTLALVERIAGRPDEAYRQRALKM